MKHCARLGCRRAGQLLPFSEFSYNRWSGDYHSYCKECQAAYHRQRYSKTKKHRDDSSRYYRANQEAIREKTKRRYSNNREEILRKAKERYQQSKEGFHPFDPSQETTEPSQMKGEDL